MKQAREMAEEDGTNIPTVPRTYGIQMHRKTSKLLHLMKTTRKPLQFHFWATC